MLPEDFVKNLESMDPARREQMIALLQVISRPPERILDMFDRLEIPWERRTFDGKSCLVVRWDDYVAGEKRNQENGPILKSLVEKSATSSQFDVKTSGEDDDV